MKFENQELFNNVKILFENLRGYVWKRTTRKRSSNIK